MSDKVRTRFAPSPTGFLHIGGARTALFAWLYARKHNGEFLLRIEDTDLERSTKAAIDAIFESMDWLGLKADKAVSFQTERFQRYEEVIQQLLDNNQAYYCDCSQQRLEALRESQLAKKVKPRYDGHCRNKNLSKNKEGIVVRFKNPQEGDVVVKDEVYGHCDFSNQELDDLIIARSDGSPTYNFCVVVDDWDMQITHVIRGADHINNTPRQINILKALNAPIPVYAHVPMILGEDGKKLSKRDGAESVTHYRDLGILPIAMRNYLARLGWSHGDQELFDDEQLIKLFDLNHIHKAPAALNHEKLLWVNQQHIKQSDASMLKNHLQWYVDKTQLNLQNGPKWEAIIELQKDRAKTLVEFIEKSRFFYEEIEHYAEDAAKKFLNKSAQALLNLCYEKFSEMSDWEPALLKSKIQEIMGDLQLKMPQVAQPLRVALTGDTLSPSIDLTLFYIGKQKTLQRIQKAKEFCLTQS